jgi:hypothetical protein
MNSKWVSIASVLSFICFQPSWVLAHNRNVEPDTGCRIDCVELTTNPSQVVRPCFRNGEQALTP